MPNTTTNPDVLVQARLTGELTHNNRAINQQAVRELIARNPYWSLDCKVTDGLELDYDEVAAAMAESMGIRLDQFEGDGPSYMNPDQTAERLATAVISLRRAAAQGATIAFATGHPGSLLELYRRLAADLSARGANTYYLKDRVAIKGNYFLDQVGGVIVLTDEGSLHHTHSQEKLRPVLKGAKPDWVVADHGFAAAAVDLGLKTVAFFDSDDPALPVAASVRDSVIAVPMNDNQTNLLTATAVETFIAGIRGN